MNKRGTSLVELLVYIALFGIVTVLIGTQLNQLAKGYSSGRRLSKMQSDSRDVLAMMSRDIRNMGCKTYLVDTATVKFITDVAPGAYLADGSSFIHVDGEPGDELTMLKAVLNSTGDFDSVEQIHFYLDGTDLIRESETERIVLAENIHALQFQYGVYDLEKTLLTENGANVSHWIIENSAMITRDFTKNQFNVSGPTTGRVRLTTQSFANDSQNVWVQFRISASNGFPENLDSIKCVIRSVSQTLGSDKFKISGNEMKIKLPVPKNSVSYIGFEIGSKGAGVFKVENVKVIRADLGKYVWKDDPLPEEKRAVKAVRIHALIRSKDKVAINDQKPDTLGNVIVTRSGEYAWRKYIETVEVFNNGRF